MSWRRPDGEVILVGGDNYKSMYTSEDPSSSDYKLLSPRPKCFNVEHEVKYVVNFFLFFIDCTLHI